MRCRLEALSQQLDLGSNVRFLGGLTQSEVADVYMHSDIFVLPSIVTASGEEENQSVALAEAQACGLPVVATRIGGNVESVRQGETGLLVPPRDPDALASAIGWLAERPEGRVRMGQLGRAHIEKHYDLEKLNRQLLEVYDVVTRSHWERQKQALADRT
jgi:colanic acid/amylovoran biosynthesis glycosyltransferase